MVAERETQRSLEVKKALDAGEEATYMGNNLLQLAQMKAKSKDPDAVKQALENDRDEAMARWLRISVDELRRRRKGGDLEKKSGADDGGVTVTPTSSSVMIVEPPSPFGGGGTKKRRRKRVPKKTLKMKYNKKKNYKDFK